MRLLRLSLFAKTILWLFLNLLLIGGVLLFIFNLNFQPNSRFFGASSSRVEDISKLITSETDEKGKAERDAVLKNYSEIYGVEFFIFDPTNKQLYGREIALPPEVKTSLIRHPLPPPLRRRSPDSAEFILQSSGRRIGPAPIFSVRAKQTPFYWWGTTVVLFNQNTAEPAPEILLVASDSFTGNGLFFDPTPWLSVIAVIGLGSILFWLPFVRRITRDVAQMTRAAERIADEKFDVRVNERRADELGRLGTSINHLASRLSGFVTGQKRLMGDISHELNSPLSRIELALSLVELHTDESGAKYIEDAKEEVELMSKLIKELLTYSKAGLKIGQVRLEKVRLHPLVESVVALEADENAEIEIKIPENLEATVHAEFLSRAVANIIRNAVRYAGSAGKITVAAEKTNGHVKITVADNGAGVPDEELEKLFDPFYRPETARARETGGAGLGLAIVKSCVEACEGKVSARNLKPRGFEVAMQLKR